MTAYKMSKPVQAYDKANEHLEILNQTEQLTKQDSSNVYRAYFDAMIMKDKEKMDSLEFDKRVAKEFNNGIEEMIHIGTKYAPEILENDRVVAKIIEGLHNDLMKLQDELSNDNK